MAATSAWDDHSGIQFGVASTFFSPYLQHTAVVFLHLLFLVIFTLHKVLTRCIFHTQGHPLLEVDVLRPSPLRVTGWLCVSGGSLSLALCCWSLYSLHSIYSLEVLYYLVQGVAFLVMSACFFTQSVNKDESISPVLRTWWLVTFLLTAILSLSSLIHFASGSLTPPTILLDDIAALLILPLATWLAILAFRGRVSPPPSADAASEPLLGEGTSAAISGVGEEQQSGYASASLFSLYTFHWISPLLKLGSSRPLVASDVPHMGSHDRAEAAFSRFQTVWLKAETTHPSKDPSVTWCLWGTFKFALIYTAILEAVKSTVMYAGPLLLDSFVMVAAGGASYWFEGYVLVAALFVAKSVETLASHQMNAQSVLIGMNVRSALLGALYQKGLRLSSKAKQRHTVGEIVNYMSTDAQRLAETMTELHNVWVLPLQIILALIILFYVVGFSMLAGLGVMVGVMACNLFIATRQQKLMAGIMECKDKRMKATTEVLNAMKIIKLYAWQQWFQNKVEGLREKEMSKLYGFMFTASFNIFILWLSPLAVSVATFGTMLLLGEELTAGRVFTAIATFRVLQEPLRSFPGVISSLAQAMVSLDRIAKFLHDQDLEPDSVQRVSLEASPDVAIRISGATFGWGGEERDECLKNINVVVPRGARVAICGSVGAGKSSLLACMLGEMDRHKGSAEVSGTTAYVAQTAWIQNGTIQENILFGKAMDTGKYAETLRCCALEPDLKVFSHGDKTEIGERGINLSGGQKQRIQLARAVYQDSDIYLLDDPFSAVDAHTGTELFLRCIVERMGEKTVVLVTHQVEFLPAADLILVLKDGAIVQSGRYEDLLASGTDFIALVTAHNTAMESVDEKNTTTNAPLSEEALPPPLPRAESEGGEKGSGQLIADEEREVGSVSRAVYWAYLTKALGGVHVPLLLFVQFLWQILQIGSDWWLARYTSPPSGTPQMSTSRFFQIYVLLAMGSGVFVLVRTIIVSYSGLKTTQAFYSSMLSSIFRAPMAFFDATPIGRILSRSSSDQATIDIQMPFMYGSLLAIGFALLGILTVTSFVTWPTLLLLLPMTLLYLSIQTYFLHSSRELSRVNGLTKAPIIAHFAESISGASTIRAFRSQPRFALTSAQRVDINAKVFFHYWAANEWMGLRLEMIGATVLCFSALMIVLLPSNLIDPGLAGLSLSYGLALSQALFYVVWIWCTLENEMVSVERIQQYSDLATEAPLEIETTRPPPRWPTLGTVEVQQLKIRYRPDLPPVLKGISVLIPGGTKVGIVGRTGSGKSTIVQALFRVVEPSGGKIIIDGLDISTIGLKDLRTKLALIPQEPTLFEGTIRVNLDPLGQYTDEELWGALDKCQLGNVVRDKEEKLEASVQENGENWSVGQRQLFCLGRALLKKSRILVLDEATASVDTATDAIIQSTIKENFRTSTVISIAHRIPTVMDSDYVLVLDQGEVAEYNSPAKLLEDRQSMFSKLVAEYAARSSGMAGMARNPSKDTLAT